jgi:AAA+ superfamily predicted ATPase
VSGIYQDYDYSGILNSIVPRGDVTELVVDAMSVELTAVASVEGFCFGAKTNYNYLVINTKA